MAYKSDTIVQWKPEDTEIATADSHGIIPPTYLGNIHVTAYDWEFCEKMKLTDILFVHS